MNIKSSDNKVRFSPGSTSKRQYPKASPQDSSEGHLTDNQMEIFTLKKQKLDDEDIESTPEFIPATCYPDASLQEEDSQSPPASPIIVDNRILVQAKESPNQGKPDSTPTQLVPVAQGGLSSSHASGESRMEENPLICLWTNIIESENLSQISPLVRDYLSGVVPSVKSESIRTLLDSRNEELCGQLILYMLIMDIMQQIHEYELEAFYDECQNLEIKPIYKQIAKLVAVIKLQKMTDNMDYEDVIDVIPRELLDDIDFRKKSGNALVKAGQLSHILESKSHLLPYQADESAQVSKQRLSVWMLMVKEYVGHLASTGDSINATQALLTTTRKLQIGTAPAYKIINFGNIEEPIHIHVHPHLVPRFHQQLPVIHATLIDSSQFIDFLYLKLNNKNLISIGVYNIFKHFFDPEQTNLLLSNYSWKDANSNSESIAIVLKSGNDSLVEIISKNFQKLRNSITAALKYLDVEDLKSLLARNDLDVTEEYEVYLLVRDYSYSINNKIYTKSGIPPKDTRATFEQLISVIRVPFLTDRINILCTDRLLPIDSLKKIM